MPLTNIQKTAVVLKSIDPEIAMTVLSKLDNKVVDDIGREMANVDLISDEEKNSAIIEFKSVFPDVDIKTAVSKNAPKADNKAAVSKPQTSNVSLDVIKKVGAEQIAMMISQEHPITIASILSSLDSQTAANVLSFLPQELQIDVVHKMADEQHLSGEVKEEIKKVFVQSVSSIQTTSDTTKADGTETTAEMLSYIDEKKSDQILEEVKKQNEKIGTVVKERILIFNNVFLKIDDDKLIQKALRNIDRKDLAIALRKANEPTKERIFKNMSKTAADMLKDDMDVMGPQKVTLVDEAQRKIVGALRSMEKEGIIRFSSKEKGKEEEIV